MGVFVDNRPGLAIERVSRRGGVPEWLKGTDCKSVGARLRWFESNPLHQPDRDRPLGLARHCPDRVSDPPIPHRYFAPCRGAARAGWATTARSAPAPLLLN